MSSESEKQESYNFLIEKKNCAYTSCYCEENVWKLVKSLQLNGTDLNELFVVFISNPNKKVPIWYQQKCDEIDEPVVWDYHVILIHKNIDLRSSFVYDLDTVLNFPVEFDEYRKKALPKLKERAYQRFYRVVDANYYLENFASDRSHMIDKKTGEYLATPPSYDCIQSKRSKNNISEFMNITLNELNGQSLHGLIKNEQEFKSFFFF